MCGLVGMFSSNKTGFFQPDMNFMLESMFINQLRGADSTGVVAVLNDGEVRSHKVVGGLPALLRSEEWKPIKDGLFAKGRLFFGHGRAATKGTISQENAHPFTVERPDGTKILFVHNGTLGLSQDLPGFYKHDVDSAWLADCVVKYGIDETFGKARGPIACMWYDTKDRTFNVYRNHERTLHFAVGKQGDMYWTSELAGMLFLKHRLGLQYDQKDIFQFPPNAITQIPLAKMDRIKSFESLESREIKKIEPNYYAGWAKRSQADIDADDENDWVKEYDRDVQRRQRRGAGLIDATHHRSYIHDQDSMWAGYITKVEWFEDDRANTTFVSENGHTWQRPDTIKRYFAGLQSMEMRDNPKQIVEIYSNPDGTTREVKVTRQQLMGESSVVKARVYPIVRGGSKSPFNPLAKHFHVPLKPNKQGIKWHTKAGDVVIRHKADCDKVPHYFTQYENDNDGTYSLGAYVNFEVGEIKPMHSSDGEYCLIRGIVLLSEPENIVPKHTETVGICGVMRGDPESLKDLTFLRGKIQLIRLADLPVYEEMGSVVELVVKDITPVGAINDEGKVQSVH